MKKKEFFLLEIKSEDNNLMRLKTWEFDFFFLLRYLKVAVTKPLALF
jgi:hypothetical protein